MPSVTPNLRLSITNRETNKPFLNWRLGIDGPDDSNMIKLDKAWGDMKTMVDGAMAAVGHAYTAATVADMTDHDKSYVYLGSETGYTAGNWYYWNEDQSAWVSGGVYNATALQTDETLTLEGEAADAKATGEMIVVNGDSSDGTRINITTTDEDIEIPTMDDVADLKTQMNNIIRDATVDDLINGNVNYQSGAITIPSDSSVFTNMIPVEKFCSVYKNTNYRLKIVAYSGNSESDYIDGISVAPNTVNGYQPYTQADLLERFPSAKYVVIEFRVWQNSAWSDPQSPAGVLAIDPKLKFYTCAEIPDLTKKVDNYYNQFFELAGDYTADYTFVVKMGSEKYKNMLVDSYASYEGTTAPTLHFAREWPGRDGVSRAYQTSPYYRVGGNNNYIRQTFRFPPYIKGAGEDVTFLLTIPQGTTLHIKSLTNYYDNVVSRESNTIKINAHSFNGYGGPINTLPSFEMAAKLGFPYCITVPKVTSDGVYVCLHDDTSIQATARNPDGSEIAAQYQDRPISNFTYSDLLQFDFGIVRGLPFAGTKIPLLEDFFKICAKTGMRPMLSVHPRLNGHWENIKTMAERYGLLDKLNIKAGLSYIETPMTTLGDDIESYTLDVNDNTDRTQDVLSLITSYGINTSKCRMGIEYMTTVPNDTWIANALSNDLFVGFAAISGDLTDMYNLIEKGVTEFTCNNHASAGLAW